MLLFIGNKNCYPAERGSLFQIQVQMLNKCLIGEVLTNTDLDRFVNSVFDRNFPLVYIEKVLDL